jgi:hypothetical protein
MMGFSTGSMENYERFSIYLNFYYRAEHFSSIESESGHFIGSSIWKWDTIARKVFKLHLSVSFCLFLYHISKPIKISKTLSSITITMHDLLRATDSSKNETQESSNELAIVYSLESLIHFFTTLFFVLQNFATIVPQIEQDLQTFTFSPLTLALQDPHLTLLRSTNLLKAIFHIYRGHTSFGAVEEVSDEYETLSYSRSDFFESTRNGCFIWADNPLGKIEFEGEKGEQALDTIVSTHECFNMVAFMGTIISTVLKGKFIHSKYLYF